MRSGGGVGGWGGQDRVLWVSQGVLMLRSSIISGARGAQHEVRGRGVGGTE